MKAWKHKQGRNADRTVALLSWSRSSAQACVLTFCRSSGMTVCSSSFMNALRRLSFSCFRLDLQAKSYRARESLRRPKSFKQNKLQKAMAVCQPYLLQMQKPPETFALVDIKDLDNRLPTTANDSTSIEHCSQVLLMDLKLQTLTCCSQPRICLSPDAPPR